jgi:dihydroneopterin aldolase
MIQTTGARVFVRNLTVQAEIGLYAHEQARRQPLVLEVEVETAPGGGHGIADTIDYDLIVAHAQRLAAGGHIRLIETYARRLAEACLAHPRARRVRVRVEKPEALAPLEAVAGVEVAAEKNPGG